MPDDRLQLPDSLEKALDYVKQQPTDWELARKRAQMWEQVSAKGRRQERWSRWWKPLTGVVAAAAVVLAAVLVPSHLPNGKDMSNWSTASSPATQKKAPTNAISPLASDFNSHAKLDEQLGQQFVDYDPVSGYDLAMSKSETNHSHEVSLIRDGIVHPILAIPSDKKVQPIGGMYTGALLGFTIVDNGPYRTGGVQGAMYFVNTDTMQVKSVPVDGSIGDINQIGVWDQRPSKLTVLFSQVDTKTGFEQVYSWEWGDGAPKALFTLKDETLKAILTDTPTPVLYSPHHLYVIDSDGSVHLIETTSQLTLAPESGPNRKELNGMFYAVGSFPNPSFGAYTGDQQLKLYSFATRSSQVLLPGVPGDQAFVNNLGNNKFLLQSFVADNPVTAQKIPLKQVPGTLQLWYLQLGQAPKRVYKKQEVGEKFLSPYYPPQYHASGYHTLLVEDPTVTQQTSALDFDWQALTVQSVTLSASK